MSKKRICILAGNGLTIDLIKYLNLKVDTSSPLQGFKNSKIDMSYLISKLDSIPSELLPLTQNKTDFDAINQFLNYGNLDLDNNPTDSQKESDLRRFLALSYSKLQVEIDKHNLLNWSWIKWIKKHRKDIVGFVSFNYDLVLEKSFLLADPKRGYYQVGTDNQKVGVPFFKPHGSIDFDIPNFINIENENTAWNSVIRGNQVLDSNGKGYVKIVPYDDVNPERMQPDIIPPTQENYHLKNLKWVQDLFKDYSDFTKKFDVNTFVIVGHSYDKVDRSEINYFISQLPKGCKFYIVNPKYEEEPIKKLRAFIESEGHIVEGLKASEPPTL